MTKNLYSDKYVMFRDLLIQARKDACLTQTELAKRLKVPQSYVSKYETGERRVDVLEFIEICDALGANYSNIIGKIKVT